MLSISTTRIAVVSRSARRFGLQRCLGRHSGQYMSIAKAMAAGRNLHNSAFSPSDLPAFNCGKARQGRETVHAMTTALAHVQRHVPHYNMQQLSSATCFTLCCAVGRQILACRHCSPFLQPLMLDIFRPLVSRHSRHLP